MSWIKQTIDFYKGMAVLIAPEERVSEHENHSAASDLRDKPESTVADGVDLQLHEQWLNDFEESIYQNDTKELTPREHGDRLLRLTKARALRRLLNKNKQQHDSAA